MNDKEIIVTEKLIRTSLKAFWGSLKTSGYEMGWKITQEGRLRVNTIGDKRLRSSWKSSKRVSRAILTEKLWRYT